MNFKKAACIDCLYTELPFLERFQAAKTDGFDYVEFWNWLGRDAAEIAAAAQKAGISICGFNGDAAYSLIDPAHHDPYLAFLKESIAFAKIVGAHSLTIHSNALGENGVVLNCYPELSDTLKLCSMYDLLKDCAALAEQENILLNLEALNIIRDHVGNFLTLSRTASELTRRIASPKLKILFDVYHMQLNEGNLIRNIRASIDQIGHIHVADAPGRHEPGTGEIHYPSVLQALEAAGYRGIIGYEFFPKNSTSEAVKAIMAM